MLLKQEAEICNVRVARVQYLRFDKPRARRHRVAAAQEHDSQCPQRVSTCECSFRSGHRNCLLAKAQRLRQVTRTAARGEQDAKTCERDGTIRFDFQRALEHLLCLVEPLGILR
jgi:hypothetical protein